jgi:hypothetical protein
MSFEKAFINQFLRSFITTLLGIFPHEIGEKHFHIGTGVDIRPNKTQSENYCKHFNSVLRTPTKFVLFSNQKVAKYFHL